MKIISTIILSLAMALLPDLASARIKTEAQKPRINIKLIHILKDKKGNQLGKVYIEDFKNDIFKKLLITKERNGKPDTLYFIDKWLFKNPKGIDITYAKEEFNGYKIEILKNDSIQLFGISKKSNANSDPAIIEWNYKKKMFEVLQEP